MTFSKTASPSVNAGFSCSEAASFLGHLALAQTQLRSATNDAAKEIAAETLKEIRSRLYPGHGYRTGALRNSYHADAEVSGYTAHISAGSELHYAPHVEYRWGGKISHLRPAIAVMKERGPQIIRSHYNPIFHAMLLKR